MKMRDKNVNSLKFVTNDAPPQVTCTRNFLCIYAIIFRKIRNKINTDVAKIIYVAFVHLHFANSIEIYGDTYNKHLNELDSQ